MPPLKFIFYINFIIFISLSYSSNNLNKITVFNEDHYRAGNFAINKNGDMIIEYSYANKRLFYGLKQNGRFFFNDENNNLIDRKEITIINNQNSGINQRYESKIIFISLKEDINNTKQYLFSTSTYITVSELYDLEHLETPHTIVKTTSDFLGTQIFSYQYSLLELPSSTEKEYILIYTISIDDNNAGGEILFKKMKFNEYSFNNCEISEDKKIDNYYNRLVSSFIMNDSLIVLFHIENAKFKIKIFNFDLLQLADIDIGVEQDKNRYQSDTGKGKGLGFYLKCIHLKENIGIFTYYIYDVYQYPEIKVGKIESNGSNNYSFNQLFGKNFGSSYFPLQAEYLLNDIIKINDNRFCFISSSDGRM